jgi:glycerophosphoryl diester phosphodiesterase
LNRLASPVQSWSSIEGPLLFAHRGASSERPENTLAAFELGLQLGADVLELDVHPSRDGVLVVSHDPDALRSAGVARALADCDWPEIAGWDAGFGFQDERGERVFVGRGLGLPRFDDVLAALPNALFNVDVKLAREPELRSLLSIIAARQAESRVLLTSFSAEVLELVRRLRYEGPLGLAEREVRRLVMSPAFLTRWFPLAGSRVQIPVRSGRLDLSTRRLIDKCHRLGLSVDYWVIDDPAGAELLLERGADGIITDDTRALARLFASSPHTPSWRARHPTTGR